ncbi:hypothetical protein SAMN05444004_10818 [Jannaschia faecimaris]|uniref:Uncharacterized protein n=1 Tax=Jannaschia faecimaris TaxID=1244108 RepID=A0A1H3R8W5_9RHOB|nr:hypothetical protein SAMN05444004_10818 [Jannaschia faecimaris]
MSGHKACRAAPFEMVGLLLDAEPGTVACEGMRG